MKLAITNICRIKILVLFFCLLFGLPFGAEAQTDINGTWKFTTLAGGSYYYSSITFAQKGSSILGSGTANGKPGTVTGTLNGNQLTFHSDYPSLNYYSDSIATVEGDTMTGSFIDSQGTRGTFTSVLATVILNPATQIDNPPIVQVKRDRVTITLLKFSNISLTRLASLALSTQTPKLSVQYEVTLNGPERRRILSKRNSLTVRDLAPGKYSASYKVSALQKNKKAFSTALSPVANFTIAK